MSKHKLTYFNAAGRAEPVRIACFLSDVSFEDHRVDFAGFGALKGSGALPLGQVPVLEVDGFSFAHTSAMLRYVAKLGNTGLYPSDPVKALAVLPSSVCGPPQLSQAVRWRPGSMRLPPLGGVLGQGAGSRRIARHAFTCEVSAMGMDITLQ